MPGKLSIAGAVAATLMIPKALSAQVGGAVNAGAAVRGAVVRGIPTPADLGASSSSYYRRRDASGQAPGNPRVPAPSWKANRRSQGSPPVRLLQCTECSYTVLLEGRARREMKP